MVLLKNYTGSHHGEKKQRGGREARSIERRPEHAPISDDSGVVCSRVIFKFYHPSLKQIKDIYQKFLDKKQVHGSQPNDGRYAD